MKPGWQEKQLGDICHIINGGTPSTKCSEYWDGNLLWITPKDLGKLNNVYVNDTARKITPLGLKNSSAKMIPKNSIIFSSRAPIGYVAINQQEMATNQGCKGIIPNKDVSTLFLFYYLKKSAKMLNELGSGTTFKELSGSKLARVIIPLPPLAEQQRIVALLDQAFAAIDRAAQNTAANLRGARELFQSVLQSVFAHPGPDWQEKRLGEILQKTESINPHKNPDKEFQYIDVSSVDNERFIIKNTNLTKGKNAPSRAKRLVKKGDVIFATVRPTLQRVAIIPEKYDNQVCSTGYFVLRGRENTNNHLLFYFLLTKNFQSNMELLQKGASYPAVTNEDIKNQFILLPPLAEQQRIVAQLDALSAETRRLEALYQRKLAGLAELKQSLLHQAFIGQLTGG